MSPKFNLPDTSIVIADDADQLVTGKTSCSSVLVTVATDAGPTLKSRHHLELQGRA